MTLPLMRDLYPSMTEEFLFPNTKSSVQAHGSYRMRLKTPDKSSEDSRIYAAGDPIHRIDWKAFARTDELIIRQTRREAPPSVLILWDGSHSMNWPNAELVSAAKLLDQDYATKAEIAARVALNIAYSHLNAGDMVNIWIDREEENTSSKLAFSYSLSLKRPSDILSYFDTCASSEFDSNSYFSKLKLRSFSKYENSFDQYDIVYYVGDGFRQFEQIFGYHSKLKFIHVLHSLEKKIEWIPETVDCRERDRVKSSPIYSRSTLISHKLYEKKLESWLSEKEKWCERTQKGEYFFMTEKTSIASYMNFIFKRK